MQQDTQDNRNIHMLQSTIKATLKFCGKYNGLLALTATTRNTVTYDKRFEMI
jgi:hypothetical protein